MTRNRGLVALLVTIVSVATCLVWFVAGRSGANGHDQAPIGPALLAMKVTADGADLWIDRVARREVEIEFRGQHTGKQIAAIKSLGRLSPESEQAIARELRLSVSDAWRHVNEQQTMAEVEGTLESMADVYRMLGIHERTRLASEAFDRGHYFVIGRVPSMGETLIPATDGFEYFMTGGPYSVEGGEKRMLTVVIPTREDTLSGIDAAYRQTQRAYVSDLVNAWNSAEWTIRKQLWDEHELAESQLAELRRRLLGESAESRLEAMERYELLSARLLSPYLRIDKRTLFASPRYTF